MLGFALLAFYGWSGGLDSLFGWAIAGIVAGRTFGSLLSLIRVGDDGVLHYRSLFGWRHSVDLRHASVVVLPRARWSWLDADRSIAVSDADGNLVNVRLLVWRDWPSLVGVIDGYAVAAGARVDAVTESELAAISGRPVREGVAEVAAPAEAGAPLRTKTTVPFRARLPLTLVWVAVLVVLFGPVSSRSPESYGVPWDAIALVLGVLVMLTPMALLTGVRWGVQASVVVAGACFVFSLIDLHFAPDAIAIELATFAVPLAAGIVVYRRFRPIDG